MSSKVSSQHAAHDKMHEFEKQQHSHHRGGGGPGQGHSTGSDHSSSGDDIIENRIYVGGVPLKMGEKDLFQYFSRFGNVENVIVIDKTTPYNTNRYGFITFLPCSVGAVSKLLHHTDPSELSLPGGRTLTIGPAKQRSRPRPGHWATGGREDSRGQHGDFRRRYNHHQPWGRRGDTRPPTEDRYQGQYYRRKDVRSASEEDIKVVPDVSLEVGPVKPQEVFVPQQPSMENFQPVPVEMMVQHQQQQQMMMPMGYELPPAYTNTILPGAYPVTMPQAPYGVYGFYDYSYSEQMMFMPQGATYYNQVGPYQDIYGQQYNYLQDPYLQNYSQQPFDCSMTAYTMPTQPLSDSGYFDISGQSFGAHFQPPLETSTLGLGGKEPEVGESPVLNMSQVISTKAHSDAKSASSQDNTPTDLGPGAGVRASRPISTPYKHFHAFNGGNLDPQGNRFPFNRHSKHVRKFSSSRSEHGQGPIIKAPPPGVKEEKGVSHREERKRHVSDSSAVDHLQHALHNKLAIK